MALQKILALGAQYCFQLVFVAVFVLCYWGMVRATGENSAAVHLLLTAITGFALMVTMIAWDFAWDITTLM